VFGKRSPQRLRPSSVPFLDPQNLGFCPFGETLPAVREEMRALAKAFKLDQLALWRHSRNSLKAELQGIRGQPKAPAFPGAKNNLQIDFGF